MIEEPYTDVEIMYVSTTPDYDSDGHRYQARSEHEGTVDGFWNLALCLRNGVGEKDDVFLEVVTTTRRPLTEAEKTVVAALQLIETTRQGYSKDINTLESKIGTLVVLLRNNKDKWRDEYTTQQEQELAELRRIHQEIITERDEWENATPTFRSYPFERCEHARTGCDWHPNGRGSRVCKHTNRTDSYPRLFGANYDRLCDSMHCPLVEAWKNALLSDVIKEHARSSNV